MGNDSIEIHGAMVEKIQVTTVVQIGNRVPPAKGCGLLG